MNLAARDARAAPLSRRSGRGRTTRTAPSAQIVVLAPGVGPRMVPAEARRPDARGVSDQEAHRAQIDRRSRRPDVGPEVDCRGDAGPNIHRGIGRDLAACLNPPSCRPLPPLLGGRGRILAAAFAPGGGSIDGHAPRRMVRGDDRGRRRFDTGGRRSRILAARTGRAAGGHRLTSSAIRRPGRARQRRRDRREGDPEALSDAEGEGHARSSDEGPAVSPRLFYGPP